MTQGVSLSKSARRAESCFLSLSLLLCLAENKNVGMRVIDVYKFRDMYERVFLLKNEKRFLQFCNNAKNGRFRIQLIKICRLSKIETSLDAVTVTRQSFITSRKEPLSL